MKFTIILASTAALFFSEGLQAQGNSKPLKIGEVLPDLTISKLMNYPATEVPLSHFAGKALLLEFCNVYCSKCTEMIPQMEALQKRFAGKLQVIRITRNTRQQVKDWQSRYGSKAAMTLPMAVEDSTFIQLFPVKLPHHAWIDSRGVVRAITQQTNISEERIRQLLAGEPLNLPEVQYLENFDPKKPLYADSSLNLQQYVQYHSVFTGYINGINSKVGYTIDPSGKHYTRLAFYNTPVKNMLKYAFGGYPESKFGNPTDDRMLIFEVQDKSRFIPPADEAERAAWDWENAWCYEVQVPAKHRRGLQELMQQDLCRYFGVKVAVEKRKVTGLALQGIGVYDSLLTRGGKTQTIYNSLSQTYQLKNVPAQKLVSTLKGMLEKYMVVDETGIRENIDMQLPRSENLDEVNKSLKRYGLWLIVKEVEAEMLVIRDEG
ncbi:TlpA family protein disulfide reductase [Desertivirga xinjiangensis]|uniref:TlpA family protein disulfide reductase n=1 Tax=Desertivirga xinjiangensis TaxID=539206 RepID=UPI00210D2310|nr:redoxin domain-containing protein [Pedobacter xinjiangensis]